jgi:hypothetical protein
MRLQIIQGLDQKKKVGLDTDKPVVVMPNQPTELLLALLSLCCPQGEARGLQYQDHW